jgi:uncharacterized protein (UPF0332 family)
MDAIQFLYLADDLLKTPGLAYCRTAVSRAYYAAHHRIKAFVESAGVRAEKGHGDVWNHLANVGDPEIEQVGNLLANLHSERVNADYRLNNAHIETPATAATLVLQARTLIETIATCQADATRYDKLKKAIQARHQYLTGGKPA